MKKKWKYVYDLEKVIITMLDKFIKIENDVIIQLLLLLIINLIKV